MKTAPLACPKCGEERKWLCLDHPETPELNYDPEKDTMDPMIVDNAKERAMADGLILTGKLLFYLIKKAIVHAKPVKYTCGKCGFTGTYKQD